MAGEDLLDERRARARHADDQHGPLVAVAEFGGAGHHSRRTEVDQTVDPFVERGRVERRQGPAHGVGGVQMPHRQGVVAEVVRSLAEREPNPQALRRLEARGGERGFHLRNQILLRGHDRAAPDKIVPASRHQRRERDSAREAIVGLVETAVLGEQGAEQIVGHRARRVGRERLAQDLLGFLVALLGQQRPRGPEPSESALASRRFRAPETADGLLAVAHRVDQSAGAEPRLGERRRKLGRAIVGANRAAEIAELLERDPQAEVGVGVTRLARDGETERADRLFEAARLEQGEAEVVLDQGVQGLQARGFPQQGDRVGRSRVLQKPGCPPEQPADLLEDDGLAGCRRRRRNLSSKTNHLIAPRICRATMNSNA